MKPLTPLQRLAMLFGFAPDRTGSSLAAKPEVKAQRQPESFALAFDQAARSVAASSGNVPSGRQSFETKDLIALGVFENQLEGYPGDSVNRIIRVLRHLSQKEEDVFGSIADVRALANAGHTVEFSGGSNAVKRAQAEIAAWSVDLFPEGGGVDGLVNSQIREPYISGATSLEWVPSRDKRDVQNVVIVPAETIEKIERDPVTLKFRYFQRRPGFQYVRSVKTSNFAELHQLTYCYVPAMVEAGSPFGVPLLVSSLTSLERKQNLVKFEDRIITAMEQIALVAASVPAPTPQALGCDDEADPLYTERLGNYYKQVVELMSQGSKKGLFLGPHGTKFDLLGIAKSAEGIDLIRDENNRQVWTALRTLPFMRGYMDSTTEALAKVMYPTLEAEAGNIQLIIARQLEFGYNLKLRLKGIPAVAKVRFSSPDSPFSLAKAQTERERMETDKAGYDVFGDDWAPHAARRWDVGLGEDRKQVPANFERDKDGPSPVDSNNRVRSNPVTPPTGSANLESSRLIFQRRGGKAGAYERD